MCLITVSHRAFSRSWNAFENDMYGLWELKDLLKAGIFTPIIKDSQQFPEEEQKQSQKNDPRNHNEHNDKDGQRCGTILVFFDPDSLKQHWWLFWPHFEYNQIVGSLKLSKN